MGQDRRQHPRCALSAMAKFFTGENYKVSSTKDLSLGGVSLTLDQRFEAGAGGLVSLFLHHEEEDAPEVPSVTIEFTVSWVKQDADEQWTLGLHFHELSEEQEKTLSSVISSLR